ncbi:MarR family transcriptional regulator [Amycolatopsis sp. OK19-0408]|uniref:MarR family transcriptional regulator n=1 Tax=Amycolatopsis iheyensis TaxID=2945988 RepID=A0A9X2NC63_9PSEU|nr:MarR family transcriptional regulator [Amycolatopsis iheyensis]MCR6484933.1 MarR family transcriptional regulator [Amycolatopsis iheyensis]
MSLSPSSVEASEAVRAVISRLRRRILRAAQPEDMTLGQASALAHLGRVADSPGLTAGDLAKIESVRHQSMTATITALAERGLVERHPDPEDGRRQLLTLTEEGRRRVEEGRQARGEWLAEKLQERCSEKDRQTVLAAMSVLGRLIDD